MRLKAALAILLLWTIIFSACVPASTSEPEITAVSPTAESKALSAVTATISSTAENKVLSPAAEAASAEEVSEPATRQPERAKAGDSAAGQVIVYQQEGGFAGRSDEWIFYDDGSMVDPDGQRHAVDAQQVQAIVAMTQDINLQKAQTAPAACCDQITYTLTVYANGESKRIVTSDGAQQPAEVTAVFDKLGQLLATTQP